MAAAVNAPQFCTGFTGLYSLPGRGMVEKTHSELLREQNVVDGGWNVVDGIKVDRESW